MGGCLNEFQDEKDVPQERGLWIEENTFELADSVSSLDDRGKKLVVDKQSSGADLAAVSVERDFLKTLLPANDT